MEFIGKSPNYIFGSVHGPNKMMSKGYSYANGFNTEFNVYSVEWNSNSVKFFFNGILY